METRAVALCIALAWMIPAGAGAQTPQSSPNPAARSLSEQGGSPAPTVSIGPKIDPAKEAAIRKLIQVTGGTDLANQMMDEMQKSMIPLMTKTLPPGDYRKRLIDLFFAKFRSEFNAQEMVNLTIRTYDKYLTIDDINGLIEFYQTPLGQKTISVLPKLAAEIQTIGMKRGQEIGQQAMQEVLTEHPDLKQALQDASRNPKRN
jgi:hypothetical protein